MTCIQPAYRLHSPALRLILLAALAGLGGGAAGARAEGDLARGESIAATHCSRCHIISDKNRFTGISSTPSFPTLVNALADWEERFQSFYARRPHPAHVRMEGIPPPTDQPYTVVPVGLRLEDVNDILAFARSLKK